MLTTWHILFPWYLFSDFHVKRWFTVAFLSREFSTLAPPSELKRKLQPRQKTFHSGDIFVATYFLRWLSAEPESYRTWNMIIYTNEGNPLGLKLLLVAKFAKKDVQVKIVSLNGKKLGW